MKTIGLIGGMSWESTVTYYQVINEGVKERLGGLHSAKIVLWSVEFDEIERCQHEGRWGDSGRILAKAAQGLEAAGADMVLICTNTMHKVAGQVADAISVPLIHIADATADSLDAAGIKRVALLGTRYTMEQDFYKGRLAERGFDVLVPEKDDRDLVNHVIFDQLCVGDVRDESRNEFVRIIGQLKDQGAQGVILGCTEIGMLIDQDCSPLPVFDTTLIHAQRAVELALED